MPQFEISTYYSQIFWLLIVLTFLYLIIARFVSPATEQILKSRNKIIDDALNEAEIIAKETENLKQEYDKQFNAILNMAEDIKKETLASLSADLSAKKQALQEELETQSNKSLAEVGQIVESFLSEQQTACISLAAFIITKITSKKPNLKLLTDCYWKIK